MSVFWLFVALVILVISYVIRCRFTTWQRQGILDSKRMFYEMAVKPIHEVDKRHVLKRGRRVKFIG